MDVREIRPAGYVTLTVTVRSRPELVTVQVSVNLPVVALPVDVTEIYYLAEALTLRWQGPYTISNWVALQQMRKIGRQRTGTA